MDLIFRVSRQTLLHLFPHVAASPSSALHLSLSSFHPFLSRHRQNKNKPLLFIFLSSSHPTLLPFFSITKKLLTWSKPTSLFLQSLHPFVLIIALQPKTESGSPGPPIFPSSGHKNLKQMSISNLVQVLRMVRRRCHRLRRWFPRQD